MVHYHPMLNKYAYDRMLIFLPGKYEFKKLRRQEFLKTLIMVGYNVTTPKH